MPEHIQYEDDDLFNPETHHEHSDVPVRPLIWAIIIFIVGSVVTHFFVKLMYDRFAAAESKRMDPPQTQVMRPADAAIPKNQPLLQPFPRANAAPTAPKAIAPIKDPRGFLFDALLQDTQLVPALLKSDRDAIGDRDVYDDAYYQALFAANRAVMERRLNDSIAAVAAMITGAWEAAGKPGVAGAAASPASLSR